MAYLGSVSCELALSIVLAPTMMVQHVLAVGRTFAGLDTGWAPQNRDGTQLSVLKLTRFHSAEVVTGLLLCAGIAAGFRVLVAGTHRRLSDRIAAAVMGDRAATARR